MQHHILPIEVLDHGRKMSFRRAFQSSLCVLRPQSQGQIKIKTNNPFDEPLLDPNYFEVEQDVVDYRNAVRKAREQFQSVELEPFMGEEYSPGAM